MDLLIVFLWFCSFGVYSSNCAVPTPNLTTDSVVPIALDMNVLRETSLTYTCFDVEPLCKLGRLASRLAEESRSQFFADKNVTLNVISDKNRCNQTLLTLQELLQIRKTLITDNGAYGIAAAIVGLDLEVSKNFVELYQQWNDAFNVSGIDASYEGVVRYVLGGILLWLLLLTFIGTFCGATQRGAHKHDSKMFPALLTFACFLNSVHGAEDLQDATEIIWKVLRTFEITTVILVVVGSLTGIVILIIFVKIYKFVSCTYRLTRRIAEDIELPERHR